jgi:hypothetical protein
MKSLLFPWHVDLSENKLVLASPRHVLPEEAFRGSPHMPLLDEFSREDQKNPLTKNDDLKI